MRDEGFLLPRVALTSSTRCQFIIIVISIMMVIIIIIIIVIVIVMRHEA